MGDKRYAASVVALTIGFIFSCSSPKTYWFLAFPFSILVALYTPIEWVYGPPDYQALMSLLATDIGESAEFLSQIPLKAYLHALYVPLFSLIAYFVAKKYEIRPFRNKLFVLIAIATLIVLYEPTHFFQKFAKGVDETQKSLDELDKYVRDSAWGSSSPRIGVAKDFVLIIGESARRDYFHLYGYPVENTPFLDRVPSTIVDGLSAGGTYTIGSLTLMLTSPDTKRWKPRYEYNLLDLVNSAGYKTYWISNQGMVGRYDTPVSSIGNRAQIVKFPKKGHYDILNISDYYLVDLFRRELPISRDEKRFFVLHTIGSHPDACKKISDMSEQYTSSEKKYKYIACYLSTIKKADNFVRRIYESLQEQKRQTGKDFSIIYFADHGMVHVEKDGVIILNNNRASKFHYDIPLIKIDSEDQKQVFLKSKKSGLRFTEGVAYWLGVENKNIKTYNLFDGIDDSEDFGLQKKIDAIKAEPDPAIDISASVMKKAQK